MYMCVFFISSLKCICSKKINIYWFDEVNGSWIQNGHTCILTELI